MTFKEQVERARARASIAIRTRCLPTSRRITETMITMEVISMHVYGGSLNTGIAQSPCARSDFPHPEAACVRVCKVCGGPSDPSDHLICQATKKEVNRV
jgi:hypothetical protein